MVTDWVKMRTDIYRDHRVCVIADILGDPNGDLNRYVNQNCGSDMVVTRNALRNVTVGALVTLWGVTRHRGKRYGDDLHLKGCTLQVLDDIADLPGIGQAMAAVDWAIETDEGVVLPRFFTEYNSDPGKGNDSTNAERQRRFRERKQSESNGKSNALRNVTNNDREEKRREENKDREIERPQKPKSDWDEFGGELVIPEKLRTSVVLAAVQSWFTYIDERAPEKRPPRNSPQMQSWWAEANRLGDKLCDSITFSMARGYLNITERPKESKNGRHSESVPKYVETRNRLDRLKERLDAKERAENESGNIF